METPSTDVIVAHTINGGAPVAAAIDRSPAVVGYESTNSPPPNGEAVEFVDYPFQDPTATFEEHLNVVEKERPHIAVAPDLDETRTPQDVYDQASLLDQFADVVVVTTKRRDVHPTEIPDVFRVGIPMASDADKTEQTTLGGTGTDDVEAFGEGTPWRLDDYREAGDVHLLGGSPNRQAEARNVVDVASVDSSSPQRAAASYGDMWTADGWKGTPDDVDTYQLITGSLTNMVAFWNPDADIETWEPIDAVVETPAREVTSSGAKVYDPTEALGYGQPNADPNEGNDLAVTDGGQPDAGNTAETPTTMDEIEGWDEPTEEEMDEWIARYGLSKARREYGHHEPTRAAFYKWVRENEENLGGKLGSAAYDLGPKHFNQFSWPTAGEGRRADNHRERVRVVLAWLADKHPEAMEAAEERREEEVDEAREEARENVERRREAKEFLDDPPTIVNGWEDATNRFDTPIDAQAAYIGWGGSGRPEVVALYRDETGDLKAHGFRLVDVLEAGGEPTAADRNRFIPTLTDDDDTDVAAQTLTYLQKSRGDDAPVDYPLDDMTFTVNGWVVEQYEPEVRATFRVEAADGSGDYIEATDEGLSINGEEQAADGFETAVDDLMRLATSTAPESVGGEGLGDVDADVYDPTGEWNPEKQGTLDAGVEAEEVAEERQVSLTGGNPHDDDNVVPNSWRADGDDRYNAGPVSAYTRFDNEDAGYSAVVSDQRGTDRRETIASGIESQDLAREVLDAFVDEIEPPAVSFQSQDNSELQSAIAAAKQPIHEDNHGSGLDAFTGGSSDTDDGFKDDRMRNAYYWAAQALGWLKNGPNAGIDGTYYVEVIGGKPVIVFDGDEWNEETLKAIKDGLNEYGFPNPMQSKYLDRYDEYRLFINEPSDDRLKSELYEGDWREFEVQSQFSDTERNPAEDADVYDPTEEQQDDAPTPKAFGSYRREKVERLEETPNLELSDDRVDDAGIYDPTTEFDVEDAAERAKKMVWERKEPIPSEELPNPRTQVDERQATGTGYAANDADLLYTPSDEFHPDDEERGDRGVDPSEDGGIYEALEMQGDQEDVDYFAIHDDGAHKGVWGPFNDARDAQNRADEVGTAHVETSPKIDDDEVYDPIEDVDEDGQAKIADVDDPEPEEEEEEEEDDGLLDGEQTARIRHHSKVGDFRTMLRSGDISGPSLMSSIEDTIGDTPEEMLTFADTGGDWEEIDGVGPSTAERFEAILPHVRDGVEEREEQTKEQQQTQEDDDMDDETPEEETRGEKVEFGRLTTANNWRDDNEQHLHANDTRRTKTITLKPGVDRVVIENAKEAALPTFDDEKKSYGQQNLTDGEREQLERRESWTWKQNGFEAMHAKAALKAEGASDWLNYYEAGDSVGSSLQMLEEGKQATAAKGAPNALDKTSDETEMTRGEMARAADKANVQDRQRAEEACEDGESPACEYLKEEYGYSDDEIERLKEYAAELGESEEVFDREGTIYDPTVELADEQPEETPADVETYEDVGTSFGEWAEDALGVDVDEPTDEEASKVAPTPTGDTDKFQALPFPAIRTVKKAWAGYRQNRRDAYDAGEQAKKYAEVINGVRAVHGQPPLTFEELEAFAGGDVLPDREEEFPTQDGPTSMDEAAEKGTLSEAAQSGLSSFAGGAPYDPTQEMRRVSMDESAGESNESETSANAGTQSTVYNPLEEF